MAAAHSSDFHRYLQAVCANDKYRRWWSLYTPTHVEARLDFDLMVKGPRLLQQYEGQVQGKTERLPVLEGLRRYASRHVLLVGRPGLGKSTALKRLLLEEAEKAQMDERAKIPVLIELRYYRDSVLDLIQSFLKGHRLRLSESQIEDLLFEERLLLLVDGLNELPYAEDAWRDLARFREENTSTPMVFTTRDQSVGSDLGIEKKLEMQPLTAAQIQQFILAYLPDKGDLMLRQLGSRLQEFGQTPLLLWMLCWQFAQKESIPTNLGLMLREFTQTYKKDAIVSDEFRRWWALLLQRLAFEMTQGHNSTELRVAISRQEAEEILTQFLRVENFDQPRDRALSWLKDLLDYHLIQLGTSNQIEFHHQLIQEYYTAESLLQQLPHLSDDRLKRDYLNYLKWTEPFALMLALIDQESQARQMVELALEVDLKLGARLAGAVKPELQRQTVSLIAELEIPQLLKIQLLGITRSSVVVPTVLEALNDVDTDIRWRAAYALGEIGDEAAVTGLRQALNDTDADVRWSAIEALGEIGDEAAVTGLRQALSDTDASVRWRAVEALGEIGDEAAVTGLRQALNDTDASVRWRAVEALGEIGDEAAVTGLRQALNDTDADVRWSAIEALGEIGDEAALEVLRQALNDTDASVRWRAVEALGEIGDEAAVTGLRQALNDTDADVRRKVVEALGEIGDEAALEVLWQALNDTDADVRRKVVEALGEIGGEAAVTGLRQALSDTDADVRRRAVEALGEIGSEAVLEVLLQALNDTDADVQRRAVEALRKIGSPKLLPQLSELLLRGNLSSNLLNTIAAIQEHCQYYNHSLVKSPLLKQEKSSGRLIEALNLIIQILKPMSENLQDPKYQLPKAKTVKIFEKVEGSDHKRTHALPQNLAEAAAEIRQLLDLLA